MSGIACQGPAPKRKPCPMNPRFLGSWHRVGSHGAVNELGYLAVLAVPLAGSLSAPLLCGLDEIDASEGIVPGGGMAEEGEYRGGSSKFITDSGDGCGDGGYCGGHWVRPSEKGHKHGEPIGGRPLESLDGFCLTAGDLIPFTGYACDAYDLGRAATK